jgi:hypothetical protein
LGKLRMWRMHKAELMHREMFLLNNHHVHQLDYCMPLMGDGWLLLLLQLLMAFNLFKHLQLYSRAGDTDGLISWATMSQWYTNEIDKIDGTCWCLFFKPTSKPI